MFIFDDPIEMICSLYDCDSAEDFDSLWNIYCDFHAQNIIPDAVWSIFTMYAGSLYFDDDLDRVVRDLPF